MHYYITNITTGYSVIARILLEWK